MRNDNLTNFAYVGPDDGKQQPPEIYTAFRPANPNDPTPIQPGETTQLKNTQTGKYCRLAQLAPGIVSPATCNTQGVICDQDTIATATVLTYTGSGLSYNGVPLVEVPPSKTLVLSSDPACTVPGGDKLTFPPAILCEFKIHAPGLLVACSLPWALAIPPRLDWRRCCSLGATVCDDHPCHYARWSPYNRPWLACPPPQVGPSHLWSHPPLRASRRPWPPPARTS